MNQTLLKRIHSVILLFVVMLFCLVSPNNSQAFFGGKIDKFTADQVELTPDGKVTNTIKIFSTPSAVRMDGMPGAGMSPNMPKLNLSIFTFKDKDEHYIFNHDKKLYYQTTLEDKELGAALKDYKDAQQVKVLGKEKVCGYKCEKKEVTTTTKIYGITNTSKVLIWESKRFDMPLRIKSSNGSMSEFRNIDKGAPSSKVFKLPKGYKKVDNMMVVMGLDFGQMSGDEPETTSTATSSTATTPASKTKNKNAKDDKFKMPEVNKKNIEKSIQNLGDKLKNFKFGD